MKSNFLDLFQLITTGQNVFDLDFLGAENTAGQIIYYRFPNGEWYYVWGGSLELIFGDDIIAELETAYEKALAARQIPPQQ